MKIIVRTANEEDKQQALKVERRSTPNLQYLERMWDDFTAVPDEPLLVALVNEIVVGVGKFTVLHDGSAWLETLRVDPDYKRRGIGKKIYQEYLAIAKKLGIDKIRMYTGVNNAASAGLAGINGFTLAGQYSGADLLLGDYELNSKHNFRRVGTNRAIELLKPFELKWESFMILNRTFYKMNEYLYKALAEQGFVYYDNNSQSVIVLGSRFMPERGLNIGIIGGSTEACLGFALSKAQEQSINKISIMFPPALKNIKSSLIDFGYIMQKSDCIVMEYVKN